MEINKSKGLHESEISKKRKIAGYIISALPSVMLGLAGINKLAGVEWMQQNMEKIINFGELTLFIGILELFCLVLYWIPKTSNLGFFLLCSYSGGIIVAEIVAGDMPIPGIIVATLLYVGTMLRKPSLFGLGIQ